MSEDIKKIKDRIKKLLALSTSDNPHEAEIALRRAMKLMARHGFSPLDVNEDDIVSEVYRSDYTRIPQFMRILYHGVADAFGVFSIRYNGYGQVKAYIRLTGRSGDVERAMYMFVVAYGLIEKKSNEYFAERPHLSRTSMNDYRTGLSRGFVSNLIEAFKKEEKSFADETGRALVPVDDRKATAIDWFNMNVDEKYETKRDHIRNSIHAANGFEDGKEIRVNEGLNTDGSKTALIESK